ncbi:SH3 domain-containing protein [Chloroflexus sp. MS-CIW-1]|uniref:SH3 domain-containing protein n=1 Tax=Chloroflexus sp. MS-CIW-1 TaxID=3055768 RepID=UPI002649E747|nr:SH3 domain-containing protein [Chloroflexus sp. MS-CIW-1]MDN5273955.1 SH3 domain-containing protein [Chloroflexus sp. MS-CIW-1]
MQTTLNQIPTPLAIGLIILGIVIILLVVLIVRRRRASQALPPAPETPPPTKIDYTAIPLEEPQSWQDRLRNLSLAAKLLFILIPILLCMGIGILVLSLSNDQTAAPPPTPTPSPIPVTLTIEDATIVRANPLTLSVRVRSTGLPDNTELQVELRADGQPLRWFDPARRIQIRRDRGDFREAKLPDGDPTPEGRKYTVVVTTPDGSLSAEAELEVLPTFAAAFYGTEPTPSPSPTLLATATPTVIAVQETPTPLPPTATPTPTLPTGQRVAVTNGGNVRKLPYTGVNNVIGGINAGEEVQILARTPNALWYYVRTVRDEVGWVSRTLIAVTDLIAAETPVANVVSVFDNGSIYLAADTGSAVIDQVNPPEVVELFERTADGTWYRVRTVRDREGWVQASLLGIPDDVAAQVPVVK